MPPVIKGSGPLVYLYKIQLLDDGSTGRLSGRHLPDDSGVCWEYFSHIVVSQIRRYRKNDNTYTYILTEKSQWINWNMVKIKRNQFYYIMINSYFSMYRSSKISLYTYIFLYEWDIYSAPDKEIVLVFQNVCESILLFYVY